MSDRPILEELLEIQTHFGLPNAALVEKDWYVVKALAAITTRDLSPFRLVFGGGTALSRAHGLIHRMSEDIDLKIISDTKPSRNQLGGLRDRITDAILAAGFTFDPQNPEHRQSMYKNKFVRYRVFFAPIIKGEGALRPEVQVDTLAIQARRPNNRTGRPLVRRRRI